MTAPSASASRSARHAARRRAGPFARYAALLFCALALVGFAPTASADSADPARAVLHINRDEAAPGRITPLKTTKGLAHPVSEKVMRLAKARVVLADYPLIKHDFGEVLAAKLGKPLERITTDEIDKWLLDSAAYISTPQAGQNQVNTPIPHTTETVTAYRPDEYGRALVYQPEPGVLIDVKGSGAVSPLQESHGNGLATLGESIREFAYEHLIHKIFEHSHLEERTVGHYAVIDAGFDVKHADGRTDPAGLILRQAHSRATDTFSELNNAQTKKIEMVLRTFGITSAGAYQEEPYDLLNLQGTRDGAILDFGGFLVMKDFKKAAYPFLRSPEAGPRYKPLLSEKTEFVHPDEAIRVPDELWGTTVSGAADPQRDNVSIWSHELATALRSGTATRDDAERHLHNLLDPIDARLRAHPFPLPEKTAAKPHDSPAAAAKTMASTGARAPARSPRAVRAPLFPPPVVKTLPPPVHLATH